VVSGPLIDRTVAFSQANDNISFGNDMLNIKSPSLVVYGFGAVGKHVVDALLESGVSVPLILDKNKAGEVYRGIPIAALDGLGAFRATVAVADCLVTLHNHYVDIKAVHAQLCQAGFANVRSLVRLADLLPGVKAAPNGYWLDGDYDAAEHQDRIDAFLALLDDPASLALARQIIAYRQSGDIALCPRPSERDEYVPDDLPRYAGPLRIIDCGAYTGVALHKIRRAGYDIEALAAFEPDPANFAALVRHDYGARESICLPLATWSSNVQLRFAADSSMGSVLSEQGETLVQCVKVDEVIRGFGANLIKLDVEGAETETLKGMEQIIRNDRPNLCISVYHTPTDLFELPLMIAAWDLGYRFHLRIHEHNTFGVVVYCRQDALEV
jgi:FkbM family methyltransferase